MVLLLIAAIGLTGIALALALRSLRLPRLRSTESLAQIEAYGFAADGAAAEQRRDPLLPRLAARLGRLFFGQRAAEREAETRLLLLSAGAYGMTPTSFLGYRLLAAVLGAGTLIWVTSASGGGAAALIFGVWGGFMGWILVPFVLKRRARRRQERIELELPELIDLLVVSLEAGLGFNAALQRSAARMQGPLGDDLKLVIREQNLGLTFDQAMKNWLQRCDAPAVRAFVRAITQGEALGLSIGQVMRELAGDMRKRRRQIVEEKINKTPIKILFPLGFLILPALLIILLYPALSNIAATLGGT